jgi:predicted membrane protein
MARLDFGRLFFAFVLIALGVLFLLDQAGQIDAGDVIGNWWPVLIILLGVFQLAANPRGYLGAGILIAIGAILLVGELELLPFSVADLIWPLLLIGFGAWLLLGRSTSVFQASQSAEPGDTVNSFIAFGGRDVVSTSSQFRGGSVTALFGGSKVDLRQAQLASGGATLSATTAFGGIDVIVPQHWRVEIHGIPLFGAFSDKRSRGASPAADAPTLTISGSAMFGGIDIKNDA